MSLYNQLFGFNQETSRYLFILNIHPQDVGRLRDSYLFREGDQVYIHLFTRLGGGNRQGAYAAVKKLQAHPAYIKDFDDDIFPDPTYATFVFSIPQQMQFNEEEIWPLDQMPMAKFKRALDDMKNGIKTPQTERAMEVGKGMMAQIENGKNQIIEI